MKNKSDKKKAGNLVPYLTGKAFDFYFDNFKIENEPTAAANDYPSTKRLMLDRFAPKKTFQ